MDVFSRADEVDACLNKKEKILNDSRRNRLNHLLDCASPDDLNDLLNFSQKQSEFLERIAEGLTGEDLEMMKGILKTFKEPKRGNK